MLSTAVIEQPLKLLMIDTTNNNEGWEWDISNRLLTVLGKRGVVLVKDRPIVEGDAGGLERDFGGIRPQIDELSRGARFRGGTHGGWVAFPEPRPAAPRGPAAQGGPTAGATPWG